MVERLRPGTVVWSLVPMPGCHPHLIQVQEVRVPMTWMDDFVVHMYVATLAAGGPGGWLRVNVVEEGKLGRAVPAVEEEKMAWRRAGINKTLPGSLSLAKALCTSLRPAPEMFLDTLQRRLCYAAVAALQFLTLAKDAALKDEDEEAAVNRQKENRWWWDRRVSESESEQYSVGDGTDRVGTESPSLSGRLEAASNHGQGVKKAMEALWDKRTSQLTDLLRGAMRDEVACAFAELKAILIADEEERGQNLLTSPTFHDDEPAAAPTSTSLRTQLTSAALPSESLRLQTFLGQVHQLNTGDPTTRETLLLLALKDRDIIMRTRGVVSLVKKGANLAALDGTGRNPLHLAARYGHAEVVETLLRHGAEVVARDAVPSLGYTPLHYAALFGHATVARLLLNGGAEAKVEDDFGRSPIAMASRDTVREVFAEYTNVSPSNAARILPPPPSAYQKVEV